MARAGAHMVSGLLVVCLLGVRSTAEVAAIAQPAAVSGFVFIDANGNGVRESSERPLPGVAVSNQDAVVATDANGAFRMSRGANGMIFVSVPDGYRPVGPFWRTVADAATTLAFPLAPVPRQRTFTFVHASDTHIAPASVERTRRLRSVVDSIGASFVLITGDLIRDALRVAESEAIGYYDLFAREMAAFRTPVWTVPGNHEIFGVERQRSRVSTSHPLYGMRMYRRYSGPEYYSFTHGGVHFVGLNTVGVDDMWYYGHVDSVQLVWLERDLALVPPTMPVVTFNHIPFLTTIEGLAGYRGDPPAPTLITVNGRTLFRHTVSNAGEALAVLRRRRHVLALGGHMHAGERVEHSTVGVRTRFHQAAAVVGPSEASGLKFLSGVTLYTVQDGEIDGGRFVGLDDG